MDQVHTFYEAVGYMISAQPNKPTQERLIEKLMELPNNAVSSSQRCRFDRAHSLQWDHLMKQAAQSVDVLSNTENVKIMSNILKTNVSACTSIGPFFLPQLGRIWLDMLGLYKAVSGIISEQVASQGEAHCLSQTSCSRRNKRLGRAAQWDRLLTAHRPGRYEDTKGQITTDNQEGDS